MDTNTQPSEAAAHPQQRPQFLTVLCVLTWIACGLLFISSVWGIVFKPSLEDQYEQVEKLREISPESAEKLEALLEKQDPSAQLMSTALSLVAIGLSAFGAYMMWQLKKKGFYVYLAGELLPYLGFLTGGAEAMSMLNSMGSGGAIGGIVVGLMVLADAVFIILYAMNLKHMTRR